MSSHIGEHIDTLATFDNQHRVLKNAWLLIRDQWIEEVGPGGDEAAD